MTQTKTYHHTTTSGRSQSQRPRSSGSNSSTGSGRGRSQHQHQHQQQWGNTLPQQQQPDEPSLYEVLAITPKQLDSQASVSAQNKAVKQAYRRALLRHHPDKQQAQKKRSQGQSKQQNGSSPSSSSSASSSPSSSPSRAAGGEKDINKNRSDPVSTKSVSSSTYAVDSSTSTAPAPIFTVDQIQHAFSVLSDSRQRSNYDRLLQLRAQQAQYQPQNYNQSRGGFPAFTASFSASTSNNRTNAGGKANGGDFATGVETVDLDDLEFDPRRGGVYHRGCRCGNARGYVFTDDDLERFEDQGILMVECRDCSLWLRVLFAPAGEDEDEDQGSSKPSGEVEKSKSGDVTSKKQDEGDLQKKGATDAASTTSPGNATASSESKGWSFNWSFNVGISLSGSASSSSNKNAGVEGGAGSRREIEKRG